MRTTADLVLDRGLAKAGYNYLVVDGEPLESLLTFRMQPFIHVVKSGYGGPVHWLAQLGLNMERTVRGQAAQLSRQCSMSSTAGPCC